ncbi:unnamed protein product [[Candida] boidinii]|uniref:Unnamed protein product n=1 Tax=Candida boidinii TaxID=5477 RepID=A0ACB5U972_CANBO|nr:unnamed protein product [[Candida] boidinii]
MLIIARGISGFGIGGEYPCSATSAMEAADERLGNRRKLIPFIFATNFPIALGLPLGSAVFLIVLSIWGEDHPTDGECVTLKFIRKMLSREMFLMF